MKIAIHGYGNIGRGVESAAKQNPDVQITGVFTRRDPASVKTRTGIPVYAAEDIRKHKDDIDVVILCGGSATDLPVMTPALAARIWELTGKQMSALHITEDDDTNPTVLIYPSDLERLPMLAEAEDGVPTMYELCRIDGNVILIDSETGRASYFREDLLAPTEGRIRYFGEKDSNIVGAYSDGVLEAAIYTGRWEANEILTMKIEKLAEVWGNRRTT